jgi:hypothetical protein
VLISSCCATYRPGWPSDNIIYPQIFVLGRLYLDENRKYLHNRDAELEATQLDSVYYVEGEGNKRESHDAHANNDKCHAAVLQCRLIRIRASGTTLAVLRGHYITRRIVYQSFGHCLGRRTRWWRGVSAGSGIAAGIRRAGRIHCANGHWRTTGSCGPLTRTGVAGSGSRQDLAASDPGEGVGVHLARAAPGGDGVGI